MTGAVYWLPWPPDRALYCCRATMTRRSGAHTAMTACKLSRRSFTESHTRQGAATRQPKEGGG